MVDETEQKQIHQSPGKPLSSKRSNSRRSVIIVLLGLIVAEAVAGGITWQILSQGIHKIYLAFAPPAPTSAPVVHNINSATFGFDPQHTHFNPSENLLTLVKVPHLVLFWTSSAGSSVESSPAVVNGVVYVGSSDGRLYAFNSQTGATRWIATTGSFVRSSPAVANGVVYVGSDDGRLYAFNSQTGATRWVATTRGRVRSSPAVANGVVYVGSFDHKLYAFNSATGQILWTASADYWIFSSPAVANGVVYVGSDDGRLYAFNSQTGAKLWVATTGSFVESSPAVVNGVVYVGSFDQKLYAFHYGTTNLIVTSISPTSGPARGGTTITITGHSFTDVINVSFGSTSANSFLVVSDTQIFASSPAGSGTIDVTVTTPIGTSIANSADQFTYT